MSNAETRTAEQFYARVETANLELTERLHLFLAEYREHRARSNRPLRVLDVGCGRRALLSREVDPSDDYWGCDIVPPEQVQLERYRRVDLNEASLLAEFEEPFDVIFCGEVVEHLFNPDALVSDLRKLLRANGVLVLSTPNLGYWVNRLLLLAGISPLFLENSAISKLGRRFRALGQGNATQGHIRLFTYRAMLDLIQEQQLELVRAHGVRVWRFPLDRFVCKFSRTLAPDVVYVLRRAG